MEAHEERPLYSSEGIAKIIDFLRYSEVPWTLWETQCLHYTKAEAAGYE